MTLRIEPVGAPVAPARPGQFHMLWVPGVGEVAISLGDGPDPGGAQWHTVRAVGAVTRALCRLRPGDHLGVRGPFGRGWDLDATAGRDVVVVAGGIGLVPLRPAIRALAADPARGHRHRAVLVGARSPDDLCHRADLAAWADRFEVGITVDRAPSGWTGDVGFVTNLIARLPWVGPGTAALVCGPEVMMKVCAAALVDRGVPAGAIQVSLERNMACALAHCGRCQLGDRLLCRDGPVVPYASVQDDLAVPER
jgi:NAD(P)H-flavin reductase